MRKHVAVFASLAVGLCLTIALPIHAEAQTDGNTTGPTPPFSPGGAVASSRPPATDAYGLSHWSVVSIHSADMHHYWNGLGYGSTAEGTIYAQAGDTWRYFDAGVNVPTGALVYGVTPLFYDDSAAEDVSFWLWRFDVTSAGSTDTTVWEYASSGQPGWTDSAYQAFPTAVTWTNWDSGANYYRFRIHLGAGTATQFAGFTIWYKRQVTPAPGTATFTDVPVGHSFHRFVEALVASGITSGCGGGLYCVDSPVTRGQMAVFLSAALGLHYPDFE